MIGYPDGGGEAFVVKAMLPHKQKPVGSWEAVQAAMDRGEDLAEAFRRRDDRRPPDPRRSSEESAHRARTKVRRLVRTYRLSYMVTLTFPGEGVHEYDRALRLLQDFLHDHGVLVHRGGFWVSIPELHPGGHGWHWHVLVPARFSKPELLALREGWTDYLGRRGMEPSGGARWVRIDVKAWGGAARAAGYAAKYVGKTFEDGGVGKYRRRFLSAQGGEIDIQRCGVGSLQTLVDALEPYEGVKVVHSEDDGSGRPPIVWAGW